MKLDRRRLTVVAALVVAGLPIATIPQIAQSESPNAAGPLALASCGASGHYFALAQKDTYDPDVYGVEANIQREPVALCSATGGSPDFVSTWTMLIPRLPNDQYAQAGWIKIGDDAPYSISGYHVFSEFSKACYPSCAGDDVVFNYGPDPGGTKNYQVYLRASDDRIVMRADATTLDVFGRDVTGEWSPDWSGQWAAEPHYYGSDVPGVAGDNLRIYGIRKFDSAGNASYILNFSDPYTIDTVRHHIAIDNIAPAGRRIRIWTDPV